MIITEELIGVGWSQQVERNLEAIVYEEDGNVAEAIKLYETNVSEGFEGTHPYKRLAELYIELDQRDNLMRVLEKALTVFEGAELTDCQYKHTQFERFKQMHINFSTTLAPTLEKV